MGNIGKVKLKRICKWHKTSMLLKIMLLITVGYGNAITKDFAQYLPQMFNEKFSAKKLHWLKGGHIIGGTAAIISKRSADTLRGNNNCSGRYCIRLYQGGKAGYIKGVAEYSYDTMAELHTKVC